MRFIRFIFQELFLRGILFAVMGTVALGSLYFLSIGSPVEQYVEAGRSFLHMLTGSTDLSVANPGFSSSMIIMSGASTTLPLAMASLLILILSTLCGTALITTSKYLEVEHGKKASSIIMKFSRIISALFASVPLFVGFWVLGSALGSSTPFILIAVFTVGLGGLGWDASRFLLFDMEKQMEMTHTTVFSTLGLPLGRFFPLPGTFSGYLLASSFPRFIPYLAGKVPAIIGAVTIAEIIFSFPGLGSTLMDALLTQNTDLLIASVFILLCVNAIVTFIVKTVLFLIYPRLYEKAI